MKRFFGLVLVLALVMVSFSSVANEDTAGFPELLEGKHELAVIYSYSDSYIRIYNAEAAIEPSAEKPLEFQQLLKGEFLVGVLYADNDTYLCIYDAQTEKILRMEKILGLDDQRERISVDEALRLSEKILGGSSGELTYGDGSDDPFIEVSFPEGKVCIGVITDNDNKVSLLGYAEIFGWSIKMNVGENK